MICQRCEERKVEKHSEDPNFCTQCQKDIEQLCRIKVVMTRLNAARAYCNARYPNNRARQSQLEAMAFLRIVHPEIPVDRAAEIAKCVSANLKGLVSCRYENTQTSS